MRALANAPDLLLADEPTAFLDQSSGHAVMDLLRAMLAGATRVLTLTDGTLATG